MAWTDVITHATGDVFPASDWNTYVRDNFAYLHGDAGAVSINNSLSAFLAAGNHAVAAYVTGETQPRVAIGSVNGASIYFGAGGAAAPDTYMYRASSGLLRTPGSLTVDNVLTAGSGLTVTAGGLVVSAGGLTVGGGGSLVVSGPGGTYIGGGFFEQYGSYSGAIVSPTPDATIGGSVQRYNFTTAGTSTFAAPTLGISAGYTRRLTILVHNASGSAITLAWNAIYVGSSPTALPASVANGVTAAMQFVYNVGEAKWHLLAYNTG